MTVVLESTTYPGTTDEDLREVLEAGSGMKAASTSTWPFAERKVGNQQPGAFIPKVVGGYAGVRRKPRPFTSAPSRRSFGQFCRAAEA
jgi:UDP-N-acetyl-D-glucosamine dehydrogenase